MRRFIAMGAVVGLAGLVFAAVTGSDGLASLTKALNGAKSLNATYLVQPIGGTAKTYTVVLAKPNLARIDTPTELIVADGKTITTYTKEDNTYIKTPETEADLKALFSRDEMTLFGAFFDANYFAKVAGAKDAGQKTRRGTAYNVVEVQMDAKGAKTITYYVDPADKLAKMGDVTIVDKTADTKDTTLIMTRELSVNTTADPALFAFTAPEGSKEVSLADLSASKWYTSLDEAQAASKKLNRPIFVDFYADW